jgi:hypothetical protein
MHASNCATCPVEAFAKYSKLRGNSQGPAFISVDGQAITRSQWVRSLHNFLSLVGLGKSKYNTHSFRIGKATDMATHGASISNIALVGRWKSDAYKKYIKPSKFTLFNFCLLLSCRSLRSLPYLCKIIWFTQDGFLLFVTLLFVIM